MARRCQIVVVPEDKEHANLAKGYLAERGVDPGRYRITQKWTGKNGNFDRVRKWFGEEVRLQARGILTFGIIALIDEDGQGLATRRQRVIDELASQDLPALDPSRGRLLVLPVRNIETWMVWGARWVSADRPTSPAAAAVFAEVDETHDYKRWRTRDGQSLPVENNLDAFKLGRVIATLNAAAPQGGLPPALEAILRPWGDFLNWARR